MNFDPVHPGDRVCDAIVGHIFKGLIDRTLPKEHWTHGAHLCAGVAMLAEYGLPPSEQKMPGIIRAYNKATGGINSDTDGYHHTVTLFFLKILDRFMTGHEENSIGKLATAILASPIAGRAFLQQFYSTDLLFSVTARRSWVEPDLNQIDGDIALEVMP